MRRKRKWLVVSVGLPVVGAILGCSKSADYVYMAPRNLGESVESWAGEQQAHGSCYVESMPNQDPKYCVPGHLEAIAELYGCSRAFVGLVDLDYDYREVFETYPAKDTNELIPADYEERAKRGEGLTRIRVRRVIEEYRNVIVTPLEEFYMYGICNEKGHCRQVHGGYYMPLWSGVNLVYLSAFCYPEAEGVWRLEYAFAVEAGKIYDFFGKSGDFEPIRKAVIEKCRERSELPLIPYGDYCPELPRPEPSPSEPKDASDYEMVPIPLPD